MEAQLQRPAHGGGHQLHEDDPRDHVGLRSVIGGEDDEQHNDHHGEKKSVLKKVKDKAKKLKNTIKKHSHGHDHEHDEHHEYRHDQISEEEEDDDDDEEMVDVRDSVVHGAQMVYESPVIPGTKLPIQTDVNLERPTDNTREDYFINPKVKKEVHHYARSDEGGATAPFFDQAAHQPEKPLRQIIRPEVVDKKEANVAEPTVKIGAPMGLEEDPHSPKNRDLPPSNYQSKVADPTHQGGKEADVAPLVQRLDNIHVRDESEVKPASEKSSGTENPNLPKSSASEQSPMMHRETLAEKVASATSVIADKAVSAKNVVASKLGYGGEAKGGVDSSNKKPVSELATEYGYKVAESLAPVYETVAGAGSAVLSKVKGGGDTVVEGSAADKGVSIKEYWAEKLKPGDEDKALSEAIADAFHMKKEVMMKTEEDRRPPVGLAAKPEEEVVVVSPPEGSETGVVNRLKGSVKLWIGGKSAPSGQQQSGGGHGEEPSR